jgi:hypothetical protein
MEEGRHSKPGSCLAKVAKIAKVVWGMADEGAAM